MFVTALRQSQWTALPHSPFVMDDPIGELLETQEHFSPSKAAAVRDCLLAAGKYGLAGLPLAYKVKFGWCMLHYKMSFEDGVALYGKYVGNWGGEATRWLLVAEFICFILFFGATAITEGIGRFSEWLAEL